MIKPSKKNRPSGILAIFDGWNTILTKVQFSLNPEEKERHIKEFILELLIIELASSKHALPEDCLRDKWNECTNAGNIKTFFLAVNEILGDLFPFILYVFHDKISDISMMVDKSETNMDRLRRAIDDIVFGIKSLMTLSDDNDLVGIYYEQDVVIGKNKRGIVYTPVPLCRYIIARTAGEKVRELMQSAKENILDGNTTGAKQVVNQFASLRILDPACGTGLFIIESIKLLWHSAEELRQIISTTNNGADPGSSYDDVIEIMTNILRCQVNGIDDDPVAIDLARISMFLEAINLSGATLEIARARFIPALLASVRNENALKSIIVGDESRQFDIIVGNPPYVNYKKYGDVVNREFLTKNFRVFNGQADLSYYFFELHHHLLVDGGISGQISSRYFMQASHAVELRRLLVEDSIVEIDDLNETNVFKGIGIHPLLFFFRKSFPESDHVFPYRYLPAMKGLPGNIDAVIEETPSKIVRQFTLDASCWCMISDEELAIKAKFERWPELDTLGECLGGAETGLDEAFIKHVIQEGQTFLGLFQEEKFTLEPELVHPWIKNGDIHAYYHSQQQWCIYVPPDIDEKEFESRYPGTFAFLSCFKRALENRDNGNIIVPWYSWRRPRNVKNLDVPAKIVVPYKAPEIRASIDVNQAYCSYDVTVFVPKVTSPSIDCIAGILNSSAVAWYFSTYGKKMGDIYEFYSGPLRQIRIPSFDVTSQYAIETCITKITTASKCLHEEKIETESNEDSREILRLRSEIDAIVFKLFSLKLDEIEFILNALNTDERDKKMIMKLLDGNEINLVK